VRYQLKTPYGNGTTHVVFEPLHFLARLIAMAPRPRVNLIRPVCLHPTIRTAHWSPEPGGQRPESAEPIVAGGNAATNKRKARGEKDELARICATRPIVLAHAGTFLTRAPE